MTCEIVPDEFLDVFNIYYRGTTHTHTKTKTVLYTINLYLADCEEPENQTWAGARGALVFRDLSNPITQSDS